MSTHIKLEELEQYKNMELLARQVVEGFITGLHKSPFHGFSVEFSEHRVYNPGESTRHIDWKLLGRSDKLFVKRYEDETNLRCHLVIDTSSSMYYPQNTLNKIKFSAYAAAAITFMLRKQRDAFALSLVNDGVVYNTPARSTLSHQQIIFNKLDEVLAAEPKQVPSRLAHSLHQLAETMHKRSLVVIFSDMMEDPNNMEELFGALQHLRFMKHEVILFHVAHKETELQFEFGNRPYLFEDVETGATLKIMPTQVKEHYLKKMVDFKTALMETCRKYKVEYNEAFVSDDFNQVLLPFFVKRAGLK